MEQTLLSRINAFVKFYNSFMDTTDRSSSAIDLKNRIVIVPSLDPLLYKVS